MAVYVVTWNLNKERSNYDTARREFIKHLERYDNTKDSGLESVRWVSSARSVGEVEADLRTKLDANDRIFVSQVSHNNHQGWLDRQVWDWINARL
ncbi:MULTISPECIES: hypothetical protein [unclassified Pseudomonas]|uniref:hypothetical protein n=1 Tax=unclassified Pseudomonas TaxID=196821 RepID=UPI002448E1EB|nr:MULTISPECIES: hypothetical protein [unclassified Pseudomonas]MDG9928001.1 hypothetical protein [Pseudomonas sp. GD04042]MDH0482010.1 hypothetical protein [Pseudomonas sp. GD04015]MDH0604095.1 hypothetical protein [Pseudomonas sp. GD03869]